MNKLNKFKMLALLTILCLRTVTVYAQIESDYLKRGNTFYEKGAYGRAIDEFTKAIEISPNNADAYYARGLMYWIQGKESESTSDFKKAAQLNSKFEEIFYNLPHPEIYTKEINKNPKNAEAYFNRGISYVLKYAITHAKSDYNHALSDYNKVIELDPKNEYVYSDRDSLLEMKNEINNSRPIPKEVKK